MPLRAVVLALALAASAVGCGGDGNDAHGPSTRPRMSTRSFSGRSNAPPQATARIGEPIESRVAYEEDGRPKEIRFVFRPSRVVDPAPNRLTPAAKSRRWVRIDVSVRNLGPAELFLDSMPLSLVDSRGRVFGRVIADAPWQQLLGRVLAGEHERGSLGFLVDSSARLEELRLSPFTGAPRTATWKLRSKNGRMRPQLWRVGIVPHRSLSGGY